MEKYFLGKIKSREIENQRYDIEVTSDKILVNKIYKGEQISFREENLNETGETYR